MPLDPPTRPALLDRLRETPGYWDVVVVGGGATGLGTAVDAAARGYSTLLLEASDFGKGTSSRSTKLVHGGVRYLQQGDVRLVLDALRERGHLIRNAPHLVHDQPFVVPCYKRWERAYYGVGLKLYDWLAGKLGFGRSRLLSAAETLAHLPTVNPDGLRGGVLYHDGQFDDSRLAVNLAQTVADLGGVPLNYMRVTRLMKQEGKVRGVVAEDMETGDAHEVLARVVVNATGVFTDGVRRMDDPAAAPVIRPSQGVHLVLDRDFLPGDSALMLPHTDDGRVLFAVPWHGRVVVGTTDTPVDRIDLEPVPLDDEVAFLLEHAGRYLTRQPTEADVLSTFAGLRPLVSEGGGKRTASISRDHWLTVSDSGLVTIAGGKWTTYRKMGEDAVDAAAKTAGLERRPAVTMHRRLHGWLSGPPTDPALTVYGDDAPALRQLADEMPGGVEPLHPGLPYCRAMVTWAARHELARTVDDVLARRTRALLLDARASIEAAPEVAALLAAELGHDKEWEAGQVEAFVEIARGYVVGDVPSTTEPIAA
ncbi:glycerol-3-phosphate dehydrogenase/oxidase [Rubrivirga marina]|uniref:FAD-dependent oxidoreductase n=1 Tax=Rubrivirga marina TaxID=1196024 RepID=A0A271IVW7_9BACT|nr:glycerol-3-phosphate dehydrogenase/oxidase [Rubrivirga marina]PAP75363.1 FAD-dependent oxidoreductase [Rubrivirga marina]